MSKELPFSTVVLEQIRELKGMPELAPTEQQNLVLSEFCALIHDPEFLQTEAAIPVVSRMVKMFDLDFSHIVAAARAAHATQNQDGASYVKRKPYQKW